MTAIKLDSKLPTSTVPDELAKRCCSEPDCGVRVLARGLCARHYSRGIRSGTLPPLASEMSDTTNAIEGEDWRPIPGYGGRYEVSDHGRVRSWRTAGSVRSARLMSPAPNGSGYLHLILSDAAGDRSETVHSLVALVFLGLRPDGHQVRHVDGDQRNNSRTNLAYGTRSENDADKVRHGTHNQASKTHCVNGHAFDAENTRLTAQGWRDCRACGRAKDARRRQPTNA